MARKTKLTWSDIANSKIGQLNKNKAALFTSPASKNSKHGNKKVIHDGIKFDSISEGDRYLQLKGFERKGRIKDLRLQVPYELTPSYKNAAGKTVRAMNYIADFVYFNVETEREVVEDFKGQRTQGYINKAKILFDKHGIEIYETGRKHITEWRL